MNRVLYGIHRWLSFAALAQLVVWLGSGLFFASFPIAEVHGEHLDKPRPLTTDDGAALLSPAVVIGMIRQGEFGDVEALEIRRGPSGPVYLARGAHHTSVRVDARSGTLLPITRDEAERVARDDQRGGPPVEAASLVERDPPIEYRDKPLPAWRVTLADGNGTAIWVDANSAEITARRNDRWRQYDFLWSLHIMDYRGRETFHHPLLIIAAVVGLLTVASGATLQVLRFVRWRRRRGKPPAATHAATP